MTVTFEPAPGADVVLHICRHMRERDRREIYATQWDADPDRIAAQVAQGGGMFWAVLSDGEPVGLVGASPRWPGVWSVWAFGTDAWPAVIRAVTKHIRRVMIPVLIRNGAHRADCYALAANTDSCRWLQALGANPEFFLESWGKEGETFICYSWLRKDMAPAPASDD